MPCPWQHLPEHTPGVCTVEEMGKERGSREGGEQLEFSNLILRPVAKESALHLNQGIEGGSSIPYQERLLGRVGCFLFFKHRLNVLSKARL